MKNIFILLVFFTNILFAVDYTKPFVTIGHTNNIIKTINILEYYITLDEFTLKIWNKKSKLLKTFNHTSAVDVLYTNDKKYILLALKNGEIQKIDLLNGLIVDTISTADRLQSIVLTKRNSFITIHDGNSIRESSLNHKFMSRDITNTFKGKLYNPFNLHINDNGNKIAFINDTNFLVWIDMKKKTYNSVNLDARINDILFVNNTDYVVCATDSRAGHETILVINTKTGITEQSFCKESIYNISIDSTGRKLLAYTFISYNNAQKVKELTIWNLKTGKLLFSQEKSHKSKFFGHDNLLAEETNSFILWNKYKTKKMLTLKGNSKKVKTILFDKIRRRLYCSVEEKVIVWDIDNARVVTKLEGHSELISKLVISKDQNILVSLSTIGKFIILWNLDSLKKINEINEYSTNIAINNMSTKLILTDYDYQFLDVYDLKLKKIVSKINLPIIPMEVTSLDFSEDGEEFLVSLHNTSGENEAKNSVLLFDNYGNLKMNYRGNSFEYKQYNNEGTHYNSLYYAVAVSDSIFYKDKVICAGSRNNNGNNISIYNKSTGIEYKSYSSNQGIVYDILLDPFTNQLISAGSDTEIVVADIENEKVKKTLSGHQSSVNSLAIDKNTLFSGSDDGTIKLWDLKTGKEIVSFMSFDDGSWLSIIPEGYFNGSKNAAQYLNITKTTKDGLEPFDFSQLYDHFFRPDLVKLKLAGEEEAYQKAINGMTYEEALKNPPPKLSFNTIDKKKVKTSGYKYNEVKTKKRNLPLNFNIKETDNGGVGLVRIYQEGKLIQTIGEGEINRKSANAFSQFQQTNKDTQLKERQEYLAMKDENKGVDSSKLREYIASEVKPSTVTNKAKDYKTDIELISGDNEICIEAFNKTNTVTSYRECVTIKADIPKKKPTLYVIAAGANEFDDRLGIGHNLKYSINDANTTANLLKDTQTKAYDQVVVKAVLGNDMNKTNLFKAIEEVKNKASLEDTVVFYISNHGEALDGELYFLVNTHDDMNDISFKELFQELQSIKSLNQIYIVDTCQSGEAADIVSSVYDSRASVFAKSSGVHMLLATTKGTSAFESQDPNVEHGVFTHKILQALKTKKSDKNKDNYISVIELSDILKDPSNNVEYQYPVIRNIGNDVRIDKVN